LFDFLKYHFFVESLIIKKKREKEREKALKLHNNITGELEKNVNKKKKA